jgi:hypothetical protein
MIETNAAALRRPIENQLGSEEWQIERELGEKTRNGHMTLIYALVCDGCRTVPVGPANAYRRPEEMHRDIDILVV